MCSKIRREPHDPPWWAALGALALLACSGPSPPSQGGTIKVGALLPFTGGSAAFGRNLEESLLLARKLFNATIEGDPAGGIAGREIEIVARDTHSDLTRGLESGQALIDEGVVAVIGTEHETLSEQLATTLAAHEILFVSPSLALVADNMPDDIRLYQTAPSRLMLGRELTRRMLDDGHHRVALLHSEDDFSTAFAQIVADRVAYNFETVTTNIAVPGDERGINAAVAQVAAGQPDAVVLVTFAAEGAKIVNAYLSAPHDATLAWYFAPTLETDAFAINIFGRGMEGMVGVGAAIPPEEAVPPAKTFAETFAERWAGDAPTNAAYYYFDSLVLLGFALEATSVASGGALPPDLLRRNFVALSRPQGVATDWSEIATGLENLRAGRTIYYNGVTGNVALDDRGQRWSGTSRFWQIRNASVVTIGDVPTGAP